MDYQIYRRQEQPRSNSVSDHEFRLLNQPRMKQVMQTQLNPYIDSNHYYSQLAQRYNDGQLSHQKGSHYDRSLSPMNFRSRATDFNAPQRGGSIKYPPDRRQPKNLLHASLECLNVVYSDHGSQNQAQFQQPQQQSLSRYSVSQQQQSLQPHSQLQNQVYSASYVLAPAPAETMVSQDTEHDLAAAAMGSLPQQNTQLRPMPSASSESQNGNYPSQSLLNRLNHSICQSPLHRRVSAHCHASGPTGLGHVSGPNSSNPMRAGHSSLSLASSTYLIEDKLQNEIKRLESELQIEKEKNEALNSQLNINSNLMAAFEQSLSTLNTRIRQLSAVNEKKDQEIEALRNELNRSNLLSESADIGDNGQGGEVEHRYRTDEMDKSSARIVSEAMSDNGSDSEQKLRKTIEDLRRQLIEKDRLLTDTRLEALSAAHQLEQLESKLNGDQNTLVNGEHEDDLDEGVMVVNHSPSDSEVATDSAHFSEMSSQISKANDQYKRQHRNQYRQSQFKNQDGDMILFTPTHTNSETYANNTKALNTSTNSNHSAEDQSHNLHQLQQDNQSNHSSSDYQAEDKSPGDISSEHKLSSERISVVRYESEEGGAMNRLLDTMLISN